MSRYSNYYSDYYYDKVHHKKAWQSSIPIRETVSKGSVFISSHSLVKAGSWGAPQASYCLYQETPTAELKEGLYLVRKPLLARELQPL